MKQLKTQVLNLKKMKTQVPIRYLTLNTVTKYYRCDNPSFFKKKKQKSMRHKRIITVTRLYVAQPTYGTCPITCTK